MRIFKEIRTGLIWQEVAQEHDESLIYNPITEEEKEIFTQNLENTSEFEFIGEE